MFLHGHRESIKNIHASSGRKDITMSVQTYNVYGYELNPKQMQEWSAYIKDNQVQGDADLRKAVIKFAKENNINQKQGVELERTVLEDKNVTTTTTTTANVDDIAAKCGITDPADIQKFKQAFINAKINVDAKGNIPYTTEGDKSAVIRVLQEYANNNAKETLTFTKESDQTFIQNLVQQGIIKQIDNTGEYEILKKYDLEKALAKVDSHEETLIPQKIQIQTTSVTNTESEEGVINVTGDKKKDKEAAVAEVRKWFDENPVEAERTMYVSLAHHKYGKEITKEFNKIQKEYDNKKSDVELFDEYSTNTKYILEDQQQSLKDHMTVLYNRAFALPNDADEKQKQYAEELQQAMVNALNKSMSTANFTLDDLKEDKTKLDAVKCYILHNTNFSKENILTTMATVNVMDARTDNQIDKDKEKWIQEEADRQIQCVKTEQTIANRRLHLTGDMKKKAKKGENNSSIEHEDIGNLGRNLCKKIPLWFGEPASGISSKDDFYTDKSEDDFYTDKNGFEYFKADDGKFYKFDPERYKRLCDIICNGNLNSLSEKDRQNFGIEHNMTLNEGREFATQQIFKNAEGKYRSLEQLMDPKDGDKKFSNRDLNKLRDFVERSGNSVDDNNTLWKKAWHIAKGAIIGGGLTFLTAGAGTWAAGAIGFAAQGADQLFSYSGQTASQTYTGTTKPTTVTDSTTFTYEINGKSYTQTVTKNITVDGQTWSVTAPGQNYSGTISADGQTVRGKTDQTPLKNGGYAAIFGAVAGAATAATSVSKVSDQGSYTDITANIRRKKRKSGEPNTSDKAVSYTTKKVVTVRSAQVSKEITSAPCHLKVRVVTKGSLHRGETMEDMVAQYYQVPVGSKEHTALMNAVKEHNSLNRFGGMQYPKNNIVYLPSEITIKKDGEDVTYNRYKDPSKPEERIALAEQDIPVTTGRYNPPAATLKKLSSAKKVTGTITRQ